MDNATLAKQINEELAKVRQRAAEKKKAFNDARKAAIDEHGPEKVISDKEIFDKLDSINKDYSVEAEKAAELEQRLMRVLDWEGRKGDDPPAPGPGPAPAPNGQRKSAGELFAESAAYKQLQDLGVLTREKARVESPPVEVYDRAAAKSMLRSAEVKTLVTGLSDTSAGAFIQADRLPGLLALLVQNPVVLDLITVGETDSDTVEYVKQTSFTNAAAETAEATATTGTSGTKPESAMAFAIVQELVRTIAHWLPATKRALADVAQLRTLIDNQLEDGVRRRLETQVVAGDGTGENLRGILNTTGIGSQPRGTDSRVDAIHKGITLIRLAFLEPTNVGLHPNDWQDLRLAKNTNGDYEYGPPSTAGTQQVWGLPVFTTTAIPEGTGLPGKYDEAILWVRSGVTVVASDSHADFFIRNLVAILAEGRYAFGVPRPAGFTAVTGL